MASILNNQKFINEDTELAIEGFVLNQFKDFYNNKSPNSAKGEL